MGYGNANFKRIKDEYIRKNLDARTSAEQRNAELKSKIPGIAVIDGKLSSFAEEFLSISTRYKGEEFEKKFAELRKQTEALRNERSRLLEKNGVAPDYDSVKYECVKCSDTGYCGINMCDCMKKALVKAAYESSGISSLSEKCSFENFDLKYYDNDPKALKNNSLIAEYLKKYAEKYPEVNGNVLLIGGTGLGKTHLSAAVAKKLIDRGFEVIFESANGMISDFEYEKFHRGFESSEPSRTDKYIDCDVLVLDDLGAEMQTQFSNSCIYNILNVRIAKNKSTIISSNLNPQNLVSKYGDRIASRLMGEYKIILLLGNDVRQRKRELK